MATAPDYLPRRLDQALGRGTRFVGDDGAIARSAADAPEIDGTVKIFKPGKLKAGDWADVVITGADAYDLTARLAR
jgi:ribosomal protein S12 methylthiotransferase